MGSPKPQIFTRAAPTGKKIAVVGAGPAGLSCAHTLARLGGDEFGIVLPETPVNGALVIAERIRKRVEDYEFIAQDLSIHLTVSLGVANCPKHTLTAEGLIKKADAAMYRAKELSKNSIKVAV